MVPFKQLLFALLSAGDDCDETDLIPALENLGFRDQNPVASGDNGLRLNIQFEECIPEGHSSANLELLIPKLNLCSHLIDCTQRESGRQ